MNRAEGRNTISKKGGNMDAIITRFGATALKRALLLGVIGALLTGFMVVNTVTETDISPAGGGAIKLTTQAFSDDTSVSVVSKGVSNHSARLPESSTDARESKLKSEKGAVG